MVGDVRRDLGDLPADRTAAFAHDRRTPRTRAYTHHPLRIPIAIQAGFALIFLAVALALHEELVNHVFDGYSALY